MKLLFTLMLLPIIIFGQEKSEFDKLIEETNNYFNQYSRLSAFNHERYLSIESFGLSEKEIKELILEADYGDMLSVNKDSIRDFHMIEYFQEKINENLKLLVNHSEFPKNDITKLIRSEELLIVKSEDNKLYNFSYDGKNGGSYRMFISFTHFTDFIPKDSTQIDEFNSFFSSDGYNEIYVLKTDEGTKYVLTGYVRGCSYCFVTFVRLITFKDNKFKEEFMYSVENRDWNDGVTYNHETKTISVDYHIDDLTPYCYCSGKIDKEKFSYDKYAENKISINCQCKFIFNGLTFELVEESWKTVNKEDRKE